MSDSQNWSSFEEEEEAIKPKRTTTSSNENEKHHDNTITAATTRFDMRQFKNRLVFGGLVGFCTGATFGTSKFIYCICHIQYEYILHTVYGIFICIIFISLL
jgi:hypothetical protein